MPADGAAMSPYASAVILISSLYHSASAFYGYMKFYEAGPDGLRAWVHGQQRLCGVWPVVPSVCERALEDQQEDRGG